MAAKKISLGLTNENFKWIAEQIPCTPEMVMAVSEVECKREPFDKDGFPAILFERHVFYRNLPVTMRDKIAAQHPDICAKTGYGRGGYGSYAAQRGKFSKAFQIHKDAAMEACSWGPFQELGENWADYGFINVGQFVDTMKNGLLGPSTIFIKSIKARGLSLAMRQFEYAKIAYKYNGSGYKKFAYDTQIKNAHKKFVNVKIDWSKVKASAPTGGTSKPTSFYAPAPKESHSSLTDADGTLQDFSGNAESINSLYSDELVTDSIETVDSTGPDGAATTVITTQTPKEQVAVLKTKAEGTGTRMITKITTAITGNSLVVFVLAKLESLASNGLPVEVWIAVGVLVFLGTGVWLIHEMLKSYQDRKRRKELDELRVRENSVDGNYINLIDPEDAELYAKRGFKIIE